MQQNFIWAKITSKLKLQTVVQALYAIACVRYFDYCSTNEENNMMKEIKDSRIILLAI